MLLLNILLLNMLLLNMLLLNMLLYIYKIIKIFNNNKIILNEKNIHI
jgi:hypothetical protein